MDVLLQAMLPEAILIVVACGLFLLGISKKPLARRGAGEVAFITLIVVFGLQLARTKVGFGGTLVDQWNTVEVGALAEYVKLIAAGIGALLVLLAMPTNDDATGGSAHDFGQETAEFFALMLLSIAGIFIVAGANDIMLLFLGIELASIPTYIMVSVSRPLPVAQEAGVKYFFLGAMAAAIMLLGFSYLYGATGLTGINDIAAQISTNGAGVLTSWQLLAILLLIAGFAFKIAAVPLHSYAGDVYQGAATPVTAFLSFVPKTSGFIAIIKILYMAGGNSWIVPDSLYKLLWIMSALTMTAGNVLGLLQFNVKRVLAYSSVAHTGYMLAGLTALVAPGASADVRAAALQGVLFYLAAYGLMNIGTFGVLILLPTRLHKPATSAETYEDLAGQGRPHVALGLCMAVCCFSLIGMPLTAGFLGKVFLIKPALNVGNTALNVLVVMVMVNSAISAAYYLKIVATLFLRPRPDALPMPTTHVATHHPDGFIPTSAISNASEPEYPTVIHPAPVLAAVTISVLATLSLGTVLPVIDFLSDRAGQAASLDISVVERTAPVAEATVPVAPALAVKH